jgi:rod shape determining protein RodA
MDWVIVGAYLALVVIGVVNIYAADFNPEYADFFDFGRRSGKQFVWILVALTGGFAVLLIDGKVLQALSIPSYVGILVLQLVVLVFAKEVNGARAWLEIGPVKLQPAEFCKFSTALMLSYYLGQRTLKVKKTPLSLQEIGTNASRFFTGKKVFSLSDISWEHQIFPFIIIALPVLSIILQNDTGTALVFFSLCFALFREGVIGNIFYVVLIIILLTIVTLMFNTQVSTMMVAMVVFAFHAFLLKDTKLGLAVFGGILLYLLLKAIIGWPIYMDMYVIAGWAAIQLLMALIKKDTWRRTEKLTLLGIFAAAVAFIQSIGYMYSILAPYQRKRIDIVFGKIDDPAIGFQTEQSLNAIGSGGWYGKGFLEGTHTKGNWVPEQSTDYIFCTVGEEWGFLGSFLVIALFMVLIIRIIQKAEKQRSKASRVYGYSVASILFFHLFVNIGMTIQLMPVIGIPLPFLSYGGSSLIGFTVLLFLFVKFDSQRLDIL